MSPNNIPAVPTEVEQPKDPRGGTSQGTCTVM